MLRDKIDFGTMKVSRLFVKQLVPNVLGMLFTAVFIITDGIFVGRGIGSDALAAVNIVAPVSLFMTGVGLMFGMGGAIVASISMARGKQRVANINATQAVLASSLFILLISILLCLFPRLFAGWMGAPTAILEDAAQYLFFYAIFGIFQTLLCVLPFFVRMGNPAVSMICLGIGTLANIVLDYLFIFVFHFGLPGAAIATGLGEILGVACLLIYLFRYSPEIRFVRLKMSIKSLLLTLRNSGYMVRLGCSAFFSELTIAGMMLVGNFVFVRYLGVNGVAAYSIVCYLFPIIFMVFNAMVQSAQPIVSYNYGAGLFKRSGETVRMALISAMITGLFFLILAVLWNQSIVSLFIADQSNPAWDMATFGLPLFALDFVFFGVNIIVAGYYMCIENVRQAIFITIMRGILPVLCFFILPLWWGVYGIWLAVPVAELLTTILVAGSLVRNRGIWKFFSNRQPVTAV